MFNLATILLIVIPLLPKIPLFSPLETYIVRVRVEDILVLLTSLVWLVAVIKKRVRFKSLLSLLIIVYLVTGLLSTISAIFFIKTVPLLTNHILKTSLHWLRYLEYFLLFFIFLACAKNKKSVTFLLKTMLLTLLGVIIYGFGQKYLQWPVFSTMNREFSKGIALYLTEHARVQSTFAGHYDLAAYLVIVLPLALSLAIKNVQRSWRWFLLCLYTAGSALLIMTASRTSFAAYGLASLVVLTLFAWQEETFKQKIIWLFSRTFIWGLMLFTLIFSFGGSLKNRLAQTFNFEQETAVIVSSDQRPVQKLPPDVHQDIPDEKGQPRTWSKNAQEHGLSLAIRLDSLWPQAIRGFLRQPFVGSGYGTLNKTSLTDFTIADSTDNNYLRILGETGSLGFLTFFGIIIVALIKASLNLKQKDDLLLAMSIAYLAAGLGLLVNAFYIDVFAASKVAFTFWALTGILVGYDKLKTDEEYH